MESERERFERYTKPRTQYEYAEVPWGIFLLGIDPDYVTVRASFIPYVVVKNEVYWLLGSFYDYPHKILTDFGGSCIIRFPVGRGVHRHNQHPIGCAITELNEESKGLLTSLVFQSVGMINPVVFRGVDENRKEYVWFIMVPLNYEEVKNIPLKFKTARNIIDEELGPLGFYEERELVKSDSKYATSRNLTDFINFFRGDYYPSL